MRALRVSVCSLAILVGCAAVDGEEIDATGDATDALLASPNAANPAPAIAAPAAGDLAFGLETRERAYGVRVRDQRHRDPRVIYSVRLSDLRAGEQLRVNSEVTLSRCNPKDIAGESGDARITPCDSRALQRSPYDYTPNFSAALVLGDSPRDASGPRVSNWFEMACPKNKHHCALALPEIEVRNLPESGERYANLVVTADSNGANARSFDVMEVEQDHGGLYVIRMGSAAPGDPTPEVTRDLVSGNIPIDRTDSQGISGESRRAVYRTRIDGLRGGEMIQATGRFWGVLGSYSTNPLITSQLMLVADRDAVRTDGRFDRSLTTRNGHNCPDHSGDGCRYEKSGAVQVPAGAPSTMYLTLVGSALRSDAAPDGRNGVRLAGRDGFLEVTIRR